MRYTALVLTILLSACTGQNTEENFLAAVDAFYTAVNAGDQATHAALFTDDAWMLSDDGHIWQRQADGSWRLHVDIWNSTPE